MHYVGNSLALTNTKQPNGVVRFNAIRFPRFTTTKFVPLEIACNISHEPKHFNIDEDANHGKYLRY